MFKDVAHKMQTGAIAPPSHLWGVLRAEQKRNQAALAAVRSGGGAVNMADGMNSWLARSPLRSALFAVRSRLLRVLPQNAVPTARRAWRALMGIPSDAP